uniref:Uncharacterized protein n=1 Tax=Anguilla anguilla TaxID=7936 RepID=A0A0E9V605_ANGAN
MNVIVFYSFIMMTVNMLRRWE